MRPTVPAILLSLLICAFPATAQQAMAPAEPVPAVVDPVAARLGELLPARTLRRMQASPDRVLRDAGALIYGYGTGGAIDGAGIDRAIAIARADARGRMLGVILRADLNADGALSTEEAAALDETAAVRDRGRMRVSLRAADADGDGTASAEELSAHATLAAGQTFSITDVENLTVFLILDLDADGRVSLDEVGQALDTVAQPQVE